MDATADYNDKMSFVRALREAGPKWSEDQKKAAARALFWLCDSLQENVREECPKPHLDYVSGNVRALQSHAEEWARDGQIDFAELSEVSRAPQRLGS